MKALVTLILASAIYCSGLKRIDERHRQLLKISNDLEENNISDERKEYEVSKPDERTYEELNADFIRKLQQYSLLIEESMNADPDRSLSQFDKAVYLFAKAMRRRNKRQNKSNYLTLCLFKICNVAGKRNTAYLHISDSNYDDRS